MNNKSIPLMTLGIVAGLVIQSNCLAGGGETTGPGLGQFYTYEAKIQKQGACETLMPDRQIYGTAESKWAYVFEEFDEIGLAKKIASAVLTDLKVYDETKKVFWHRVVHAPLNELDAKEVISRAVAKMKLNEAQFKNECLAKDPKALAKEVGYDGKTLYERVTYRDDPYDPFSGIARERIFPSHEKQALVGSWSGTAGTSVVVNEIKENPNPGGTQLLSRVTAKESTLMRCCKPIAKDGQGEEI